MTNVFSKDKTDVELQIAVCELFLTTSFYIDVCNSLWQFIRRYLFILGLRTGSNQTLRGSGGIGGSLHRTLTQELEINDLGDDTSPRSGSYYGSSENDGWDEFLDGKRKTKKKPLSWKKRDKNPNEKQSSTNAAGPGLAKAAIQIVNDEDSTPPSPRNNYAVGRKKSNQYQKHLKPDWGDLIR